MEGILQYWEQLIFFLTALVVAVKLHTDVTTLKKDVEKLEEDCKSANEKIQNNFVSSVRTESAVKETEKKINRVAGRYASEDEAQDVLDQVRNLEDTEVSYDTCVEVIATASRALPAKGGPSTYKVLQFCYDKYNFGRLGKTSRKVKREYGISHDGDRRNRRRR